MMEPMGEHGTFATPQRLFPFLTLALLAWAGLSIAAHAEACPALFADGRPPVVTNPRLSAETTLLCNDAFAVLYSGVTRTPLYAAERLTRASVAAARGVDRTDSFHEEDRLPGAERASLSDYTHSGYDRGHMAPAGDMPSLEAQAQSFSLANMVPQNRSANRSLWAAIEESVRRLARQRGALFVVTGPVFSGASVKSIGSGVLVPTQLYKAVYDPSRGEAAAYLADNEADGVWRVISLAELKQAAGFDVFPALSEAAKARPMSLPEPKEYSRGGNARGGEASFDRWLRNELHRGLRRLLRELLHAIF